MAVTAAQETRVFLLALQFLTRLPVRIDHFDPDELAASPRWYPGVGVVVGAMAALTCVGAELVWPPLIAAMLAVAVGVLVTGGLHEDGFADACDGLGGGRTRERALEIMRDSRIGSYGAIGLVLMLGARVAVLAALPSGAVAWALVAGHVGSRASMLWVMQVLPYARKDGAGSAVAGGLDAHGQRVAAVTTGIALLLGLLVLPVHSLILGLGGLVLGHVAMRRRFAARLGGYTGDCLGAVQQCSEIGFYLGLLAFLGT
jgi:adenosylcobinamide-GDP ribazoletransferase